MTMGQIWKDDKSDVSSLCCCKTANKVHEDHYVKVFSKILAHQLL